MRNDIPKMGNRLRTSSKHLKTQKLGPFKKHLVYYSLKLNNDLI